MRRLISLVAVALVMAAMVLASVMPAFAVPPTQPPTPPGQSVYQPGQYYCYKYDPVTDTYIEEANVPRGQIASYEAQGYSCFSQRYFS
jgi:hypothetical protein